MKWKYLYYLQIYKQDFAQTHCCPVLAVNYLWLLDIVRTRQKFNLLSCSAIATTRRKDCNGKTVLEIYMTTRVNGTL